VKLDIGCGRNKRAGFIGIDFVAGDGVDIVHDLTVFPWPIETNASDEIVMSDVIEHLPNTVATFNELHRIARRGCRVEITYPYWRSFGCYSDPTHIHYFNENLIEYFMRPGTSAKNENRYSYYTKNYWKLISRELITYPFLRCLPDKMLSFLSRHFLDVVHGVRLIITPDKSN
jgi:SAM-dependent methyltransferase